MTRHNNFDSVRMLAAAAVIYGHAHPLTGTPDLIFLGNSIQSFAVKVFFVVSGFLVARSWGYDPNPVRYLAKRGLRIFPALLLCLAVTIMAFGPLVTTLSLGEYFTNPGTWMYGAYNAVLYPAYSLPGVFADNVYPGAVNGSLWSLPVEFLMYLIFPLVYAFSRLGRSNALLVVFSLAFCVVSLYAVRVSPLAQTVVWYGTGLPSVLDTGPYFFLGALFSMTKLERLLNPTIALFLIGLLVFVHPVSAVASEVALYLAVPYCVLSYATAHSPVLGRVGRLGDPSYGIYLYGFVVQQVVGHYRPGASALENTLIALPIAVLLAYGSWHAVEQRALSIKPRSRQTQVVQGLPSEAS